MVYCGVRVCACRVSVFVCRVSIRLHADCEKFDRLTQRSNARRARRAPRCAARAPGRCGPCTCRSSPVPLVREGGERLRRLPDESPGARGVCCVRVCGFCLDSSTHRVERLQIELVCYHHGRIDCAEVSDVLFRRRGEGAPRRRIGGARRGVRARGTTHRPAHVRTNPPPKSFRRH